MTTTLLKSALGVVTDHKMGKRNVMMETWKKETDATNALSKKDMNAMSGLQFAQRHLY